MIWLACSPGTAPSTPEAEPPPELPELYAPPPKPPQSPPPPEPPPPPDTPDAIVYASGAGKKLVSRVWLADGRVVAGTPGGAVYVMTMPTAGAYAVEEHATEWLAPETTWYQIQRPAGDLDGDGSVEVFVRIYDSIEAPDRWYAAAPEALTEAVVEIWPAGHSEHRIPMSIGDYDGDGTSDLALNDTWDETFEVFVGPFGPHLDPTSPAAVAERSSGPTAYGDTDGDGRDDLAGTSIYGAWVLLGGQEGDLREFENRWWEPPTNDTHINVHALTDLDDDGYADLILGDTWRGMAGFVTIEYGPIYGWGVVEEIADVRLEGIRDDGEIQTGFGGSVAIGDYDGDGSADLAVDQTYGRYGREVLFYLAPSLGVYGIGDADATLRPVAEDDNQSALPLLAQDLDGDGQSDLLVVSPYDDLGGEDAGALFLFLGSSLF